MHKVRPCLQQPPRVRSAGHATHANQRQAQATAVNDLQGTGGQGVRLLPSMTCRGQGVRLLPSMTYKGQGGRLLPCMTCCRGQGGVVAQERGVG